MDSPGGGSGPNPGGGGGSIGPGDDTQRGIANKALLDALNILARNQQCADFLSDRGNYNFGRPEDRDAKKILEAIFPNSERQLVLADRSTAISLFPSADSSQLDFIMANTIAYTYLGSGRMGKMYLFPYFFDNELSDENRASVILHEVGHMTGYWNDNFPNNYYGGIEYQDALSVNCDLLIFLSHPQQ